MRLRDVVGALSLACWSVAVLVARVGASEASGDCPMTDLRVCVWLSAFPCEVKLASGRRRIPMSSGVADPFISSEVDKHGVSDLQAGLAGMEGQSFVTAVARLRVESCYHHLLQLDDGERWQYKMWHSILAANFVGHMFSFKVLNIARLDKPQLRQQLAGLRARGFVVDLEDGEEQRLADHLSAVPAWLGGRLPLHALRLLPDSMALMSSGAWQILWVPNLPSEGQVSSYWSINWRKLGIGEASLPGLPGHVVNVAEDDGAALFDGRSLHKISQHLRMEGARLVAQGAEEESLNDISSLVARLQEFQDELSVAGLAQNLKVGGCTNGARKLVAQFSGCFGFQRGGIMRCVGIGAPGSCLGGMLSDTTVWS